MLRDELSCQKGRLLLSGLVLKDADPNDYAVAGVDCVVGHKAFLGHLCHLLRITHALEAPHCSVHSPSPPPYEEGGTGRPRLKLINGPSVKAYKDSRNF